MVEQKKTTKNYPTQASHSLILEATPLYTTILTEELNRLYQSEANLRREVMSLRSALMKMTSKCEKP
jgi:hypothetical protein